MSDVPLAHKYSAETYDRALSNLLERWKQGDGKPVKYDEAAIGMDKSTVSAALKFLGKIGLLEVPKAGSYIVPQEVLDYRTKIGDVQSDAKREAESRLEEYPLYTEAKFMLGINDFTLEELREAVSGSAAVAASQDELSEVERSLKILAALDFLEIDEEGYVSVPDDLGEDSQGGGDEQTTPKEENSGQGRNQQEETSGDAEPTPDEATGGATVASATVDEGTVATAHGAARLRVEMDISMDVTEMRTEEVRKKLEAIDEVLGENAE